MADTTAETGNLGERYHFAIRRIHSLSGIIPVGVFLCVHLSVNGAILAGPDSYQFAVDQIHILANLGILKPVEVAFIFLPIAFHAIVGVIIWLEGKPNLTAYKYGGNVRYVLQRWTGVIAFIFILLHLWHVHWIIPGGTEFDPHDAARTTVQAMTGWWTGPVYAIGVLCAVFHLANGIWTFLITWGVTIGPRSQALSGRVCLVIGIGLGLLGMASLIKIRSMDASTMTSPPVEQRHATGLDDGMNPYS